MSPLSPRMCQPRQNIKVMTDYLCVLFAHFCLHPPAKCKNSWPTLNCFLPYLWWWKLSHLFLLFLRDCRWTFSFLLMILTAVWLLGGHCHVNHAAVPRMQQHEGENLSDIIETIWSNICGPISMKDICRVAQPSLMISNGGASLTHFFKKIIFDRERFFPSAWV